MAKRRDIAGAIRSGAIGGGLRPHVFGSTEALPGPCWLALLLNAGVARFASDDAEIRGPALVWRPWAPEARATFMAGAEGIHVTFGSTALASAVGHMPVSQDLLEMARRSVAVPLTRGGDLLRTLGMAFAAVHREANSRQSSAHAMVEAYLRIILVEVYRIEQDRIDTGHGMSPSHRIYADFGTLVEGHFRERWTVNDYAQALSVSRDRLGDVCRRIRGCGPKEVIDRRVALEARLLLEGSSSSIKQVAGLLGFASAAQFNQFFMRVVGNPPGGYRKLFLDGVSEGASEPRQSYEWP